MNVRKLPWAVQWLLLPLKPEFSCTSLASEAPLGRDAVAASLWCISLLQHPCKRLFFLFASFLHDRWHLGGLRAFWWRARRTETWLTREASNSQKCEQYFCSLVFALGACGTYCSSEWRWLLDPNIPSFHSSLPPARPSVSEGEKPGSKEAVQKHRNLSAAWGAWCCWGAVVAMLCRCFWQYLCAALDRVCSYLLWAHLKQRLSGPLKCLRVLI